MVAQSAVVQQLLDVLARVGTPQHDEVCGLEVAGAG